MSTADPEKAIRRFRWGIARFIEGARAQRERILRTSANAPRIPAITHQVTDLRGTNHNDVDYYIYELGRLRYAAMAINETFGDPPQVVDALADFDAAIPQLRHARNPLTHVSDDARIDDVAWFEALVRLLPTGDVEYLVDPRFAHHDAAEALASSLLEYLRGQSAASPSAP